MGQTKDLRVGGTGGLTGTLQSLAAMREATQALLQHVSMFCEHVSKLIFEYGGRLSLGLQLLHVLVIIPLRSPNLNAPCGGEDRGGVRDRNDQYNYLPSTQLLGAV